MKKATIISRFFSISLLVVILLHLFGEGVLAAEEAGKWRPIYDTVLRWFNFGIMVFLFMKYGKTPLKNFFTAERTKIAREIEQIEAEKKDADDKIAAIQASLDESHARFGKMKERIVKQGDRKRERIIEDAQRQCTVMMEDVEHRVNRVFSEAKEAFESDLIDAAIAVAQERLPDMVTDDDSDKVMDHYLSSMAEK
ncbi:MAG: ATP synthase F0 subunit B [Desulfobacterales bacterium]